MSVSMLFGISFQATAASQRVISVSVISENQSLFSLKSQILLSCDSHLLPFSSAFLFHEEEKYRGVKYMSQIYETKSW